MISPASTQIPSVMQCTDFFDQYEMLDNIRAHSILVARLAGTLVDGLERAGKSPGPLPNREETIAGALLHDIAKTLCIKTGCHHAEVGRQICVNLGYPKIGEIVAEHVVLRHFYADFYQRGVFGAKELVYYADKRVRHDQIVPLAGRLEYIIERYGNGDPLKEEMIHLNFKRTFELEKHLFNFLDLSSEDVTHQLSEDFHFTKTAQR